MLLVRIPFPSPSLLYSAAVTGSAWWLILHRINRSAKRSGNTCTNRMEDMPSLNGACRHSEVSRADLLLACVIVRELGSISSQTLDNALDVFQHFRKIYVSKDTIMSKNMSELRRHWPKLASSTARSAHVAWCFPRDDLELDSKR
jgi:hypothetical protein